MTPGAVLAAGEVSLRAWEPDDARRYMELRDELVFRFTTESPDLDESRCRSNITDARADPRLAPLAICDPNGNPVGNLDVVRKGSAAVISYWLGPAARGKGWATEALMAGTDWAFSMWDLDYAELEIAPDNAASISVAEAAGYRRHGTRLESSCGGPALLFRHPAPD